MLEITVKTLDSQNHSFTCEDDITVQGFKEHIADRVSVSAESQRLIYCGRVLQNDKKLNDYDVNGKVIHLVQRAPPQPESRSSTGDTPRQNNNQGWPHARVQFRGQLHRNAMYLGSMSLPPEYIEDTLGPVVALSNTLSQTRLAIARRMLDKVKQLMDRLDDPSVPLHPSPTENNASEPPPQASAPEETDQASNVNSNINNVRNGTVPGASEIDAAFSAAAFINIRLDRGEAEDGENIRVNLQAQAPETETSCQPRSDSLSAEPSDPDILSPEAGSERAEPERPEPERPDASTSSNTENSSRLFTTPVPRPPQMAELLERLVNSQDRLRPYIERYRVLMLADPSLNSGNGPESVTENQRIIDGVSESLHFLSHACHALSDIIVDMEQQPPRNLRCRPIIVQHSAILQAGIPVQVESQMNVSDRNPANNNNSTDEGNEATRPSSPTSGTSDQTPRSINIQSVLRSATQNTNGQLNPANIFGTLLSMPSNVELSMDLSPQSAMDLSSPSAVDGSENEQGQSNNNNNGNGGDAGQMYSMTPPFALIRDALQSVLSERHNLMETSSGTATNTPTNAPFVVTIGGQQMDIGTPNSGQSTQARSNIGTHPTTSTQTRSTARPHVLQPHNPQIHVGLGIGRNMEFDPFLPCNSHHVRREAPRVVDFSSTSQSTQPNQNQSATSTTSESHSRTQSASHSSTASNATMPSTTVYAGPMMDNPFHSEILEIARLSRARPTEFLVINGNNANSTDRPADTYLNFLRSSDSQADSIGDVSLADFLRTLNVRVEEFSGRNLLIDLWVHLFRNITFGDLMQLGLGQHTPLARLRRSLRGCLEHYFPDATQSASQEQAAEQIVSYHRPYLQAFIVPEDETASRRVDVPATIEALLRKFYLEFLKLLCNNDLDDATFAQEAVTLAKRFVDQSSVALQYIVEGGPASLETVLSRFVTRLTEGSMPQFFQQTLLGLLSTQIHEYATRTTEMSRDEIANLLVYKDEPSAPRAEAASVPVREPLIKQKFQKQKEAAQAQALPPKKQKPTQQQPQQQSSPLKKEATEEAKTAKPEPMDTELLEDKVVDDPMDLANGEEIPETFPGAENLPADWVPIIARDAVRQRRQVQVQALQGGPIPFSDAYLTGMPSKRRKLIEQQKPQLLVNPTRSNTVIAASVERLVREGISHSHLQEADGAASAVATAPGVRNAFGQAIKECLHPSRLKTPDFPNSRRFPNASKYFADGDKDKKEDSTPASTTKTNK